MDLVAIEDAAREYMKANGETFTIYFNYESCG